MGSPQSFYYAADFLRLKKPSKSINTKTTVIINRKFSVLELNSFEKS